MLAPNNSLQFAFGITSYDEWCEWAFKMPIGFDSAQESEDRWIERILHTTEALLEQRQYIETIPGYTKSEKDRERRKINKRLSEIIDTLGYLPSYSMAREGFHLSKDELSSHGLYNKVNRTRSKNNLTLLIEKLLLKGKVTNINELWSYLSNKLLIHVEKLVYVYSTSGNHEDSTLEWSAKPESKAATITKKSLGKKLSTIKQQIKINKEQ